MKKLFLATMMVLASLTASAQHAVGGLTLQPQVGMTLSTLTDSDEAKMKVGLVAGAELEYQATDMLGIAAGLQYSMQGAALEHDDDNTNLDYLNIPIRAKVYVAPGFSINAGMQFGFMTRAKNGDADLKDNCKTFDFSIPLGLSYEISNVVIDARYNLGLTDVNKDTGVDFVDDKVNSKNSVIMLTVGYRFDL